MQGLRPSSSAHREAHTFHRGRHTGSHVVLSRYSRGVGTPGTYTGATGTVPWPSRGGSEGGGHLVAAVGDGGRRERLDRLTLRQVHDALARVHQQRGLLSDRVPLEPATPALGAIRRRDAVEQLRRVAALEVERALVVHADARPTRARPEHEAGRQEHESHESLDGHARRRYHARTTGAYSPARVWLRRGPRSRCGRVPSSSPRRARRPRVA